MNKLEQLRWIKELALSIDDPVYYLSNYATCVHSTHGNMPFIPHDYQRKYIEAMMEGSVIVSATRNVGLTITTAMYLFWYGMFNSDKNIAIASSTRDLAINSLQIIRFAYDNLPDFMKEGITMKANNKTEICFNNGTRFFATAVTECAFRGQTLSLLHLDNFGLLSNRLQESTITSVMPTMCNGTSKMFITSCEPLSGDSIFHKIYTEAADDRNSFTAIKMI